jgi:hypothetical protein
MGKLSTVDLLVMLMLMLCVIVQTVVMLSVVILYVVMLSLYKLCKLIITYDECRNT